MKKLKINFIFITILILSIQVINVFGTSNVDNDTFDSDAALKRFLESTEEATTEPVLVPDIKLESPTSIEVGKAGVQNLEFNFKNASRDPARNIYFELSFDTSAPFMASFTDDSNIKNYMGGLGTHTANIKLEVFENAKDGIYPLNFDLTFYDDSDKKTKFTSKSTVYIKIKDMTPEKPIVLLEDFKLSSQSIVAGDDFTISANINNVNKSTINNLQVTIDGLASDKIYNVGSNSNFYHSTLNGSEKVPISFKLHASKDISTSSNELKFKVVYNDAFGTAHELVYPYFVNVNKSSSSSTLKIDVASPNKVHIAEEIFTVTATVTNTGTSAINDIVLTATPQQDQAISPMSANTQNIPTLAVGESLSYKFKFMPTKESTTKTYVINITAKYNSGEKEVSITNYGSASVHNEKEDTEKEKEEETKSVPKIILSNYTTNPTTVYAGEPFELTMDFLNTSQSSDVKNIKVFLSVPTDTTKTGNVFSPVNGSNTFYMYNIPAGGVVTKTLQLQPDYNATAKNYDLNVTMEYEDSENKALTQTEIVGIKVNQIIKLEYGSLEVPESAMVNANVTVGFQFYNTGKVDLSNLKMKIVGDTVDATNSETFFGKLAIGSSEYFDGAFKFTEPGEAKAYVLISYEDENGTVIEDKVDFTCFVQEESLPEDFENMFPPEETIDNAKTGPNLVTIAIIVGLILAAIIAFIIIKRKRLKREDDDLIE